MHSPSEEAKQYLEAAFDAQNLRMDKGTGPSLGGKQPATMHTVHSLGQHGSKDRFLSLCQVETMHLEADDLHECLGVGWMHHRCPHVPSGEQPG